MKKLFANVGAKMAALADDIAAYNDGRSAPMQQTAPGRPAGPGGPDAASEGHLDLDFDPVLEHLLRNVRSRHVRQHFARTPAHEYTELREVTIQAATFNVGGRKPPPGLRLDPWLGAPPGCSTAPAPAAAGGAAGDAPAAAAATAAGCGGCCWPAPPDVVAVGFQELVPLSAGNVVMGVWSSDHAEAWDRCLAAHLNGEEWAAQRYGPAQPSPAAATPATPAAAAAAPGATTAAAVSLLDSRWHGGPSAAVAAAAGTAAGTAQTQEPGVAAAAASATGAGSGAGSGGCSCPPQPYVQVASRQLVGVYLSVWVRGELLPAVRGVQVTSVATGFKGYLGNKGAVAARMRLYDSSIVFLAAHLAAGEAEGDEARRNADVHDILRRAAFVNAADGGGAVAMTAPAAALVSASLGPGHWPPGPSPLPEHDLLIWVGDLNYRLATAAPPPQPAAAPTGGSSGGSNSGNNAIDGKDEDNNAINNSTTSNGNSNSVAACAGPTAAAPPLTDADVRAAIRAGRLGALLGADQLNRERAAGRVFRGWQEGPITFPPTYKFRLGSHTYQGDDIAAAGSGSSGNMAALDSGDGKANGNGSNGGSAGDDDSTTGPTNDAGSAAATAAAASERAKRRTPAWCDRVLWAVPGAGAGAGAARPALRQLGYWRGELTVSDHKPVAALFSARVVRYDRRRIAAALEGAMRAVDRLQEGMRPRVSVSPAVLDAGQWVALGVALPLRLQLRNQGAAEALWHWLPAPQPQPQPQVVTTPGRKTAAAGAAGAGGDGGGLGLDDETPPLPGWLSSEPAEGVLAPGQTCEVTLTVLVEGGPAGAAAALLAAGMQQDAAGGCTAPLEHIAILRIEDSGDKFISIGGRYLRSFVGLPLPSLAQLGPHPALPPATAQQLAAHMGLPPLQLGGQEGQERQGCDIAAGLPKEVAALLAALRAGAGAALRAPGVLADSAALVLLRTGQAAAEAGAAGAGAAGAGGEGEEGEAAAAAALQPTGGAAQRALLRALTWLRLHLDAGSPVPPGTAAHDIAAMLLLWCGQLPQPLIPAAAAEAAAAAPPASAADAVALLRAHCGRWQLLVVSELLRLLRTALAPATAACNGLTAARLAAAVGAWWLPPLAVGAAADAGSNRRAWLRELLSVEAEAGLAVAAAEVAAGQATTAVAGLCV